MALSLILLVMSFPPLIAAEIIGDARRTFDIVTLTAKEYEMALKAAAALQVRGAQIYDALLLACARKIDARKIYTKNVKHWLNRSRRILHPASSSLETLPLAPQSCTPKSPARSSLVTSDLVTLVSHHTYQLPRDYSLQ